VTCPHCGFENLEENATCFRCGQGLDLSDVEVEPARLRRGPSSSLMERLHVWLNRRTQRRPSAPRMEASLSALLSIVPGLGQWLAGHPRRGLLMLGLWAVSLAASLAMDPPMLQWPSMVPEMFIQPRWLPLTVHAFVMADAYRLRLRTRGRRVGYLELMAVTLAATALLSLPVYTDVAQRMASNGTTRLRVMYAIEDPLIQQGDVIVVRDGNERDLARGAVVVFRIPGHINQPLLGTVLAARGDFVEWSAKKQRLTVNGAPVAVPRWIAELKRLEKDERLVIPEGELLAMSVPLPWIESLREALVREANVEGRVIRILEPPARARQLPARGG